MKNTGGFEIRLSNENKKYKSESKITEIASDKYRKLRDTQQQEYSNLVNNYKIYKPIFLDRIAAIQNAIRKDSFEKGLLDHSIIGNDSYWYSFNLKTASVGRKYGATHRLLQIDNALEIRRTNIGIKLEESPSLIQSESLHEFPFVSISQIRKDIITLSQDIDILKEEVTVYNEVMKKESYSQAKSHYPALYYRVQKEQFDALKLKIKEMGAPQDIRIKELEAAIDIEQGNPESSKFLNSKQERDEIFKRWEWILIRENEITQLFKERVSSFKLSEKEINSKDVVLHDFSSICHQALDLLRCITAFKEDIVLGNDWEKWASKNQRHAGYFQALQKAKVLEKEKLQFENQSLPERNNILDKNIQTYSEYISAMNQDLNAINDIFDKLRIENQERGKWQVSASKI
jgi:hypothetical protein